MGTLTTPQMLKGVKVVASSPTTTPSTPPSSRPKGSSKPVSQDELNRAVKRIQIVRFLDDGRQTLGKMQVYDTNSTTQLFELTSVELPWLNNKNSVSCIPPGKYLVRPYYSDKYSNCFWVYSNEAGGWKKNNILGNGYSRSAVLIHRAPNSTWLAGCIGPGNRYNPKISPHEKKDNYASGGIAGNLKGNPYGVAATGDESFKALNKLTDTLWKAGEASQNSFYMEIKNNPNGLLSGGNQANQIMDLNSGSPKVFIDSQTS
jgi:hypothetical protein